MHLLAVLLTAVLLTMCPPALAQELTTEQVVSAVESAYAGVDTIKADFVQVTRSAAAGEEPRQKGVVLLKRPRKMRWNFTQPMISSFITDGQKMWVWSAESNQVILTEDLSASSGNDMAALLSDLGKLGELFDVQHVESTEADEHRSHILQLKPKTEASFKSLQLVVSRKKYTLERLVMVDLFDNIVELDFSAVRMNPEITDEQFTFQIPEGATVIRADGM